MLPQTDELPTPGPSPAPAPHMPAATRAVLIALGAAIGDDTRLPAHLPLGEAAVVLAEIHKEQAKAAWSQLVSRYTNVDLRARDLSLATIQAVGWVGELIGLDTGRAHGHGRDLAVAALVAALTRRLIIDGEDCARKTVDACARRLRAAGQLPSSRWDLASEAS